ncbi:MAG: tyrosine-type recombinase/integrase [Beijerinckiaceae bacterium]
MAPDDLNPPRSSISTGAGVALNEPSFLDAIQQIEADPDLPRQTKTHWGTSLRSIARWLDTPIQSIPARWTSVRFRVEQLHAARLNVVAKTLANHKSNLRAALRWMRDGGRSPARGVALAPDWAPLAAQLEGYDRHRLSGLMRYCSGRGVAPGSVSEEVLSGYLVYRAATTRLASGDAARRLIARAWNAASGKIDGWPSLRLAEPPPARSLAGPDWEAFPAQLRQDIEEYLLTLKKPRRLPGGRRSRPNKPSTIRLIREKLVAAVRMAVRSGLTLDSLDSLRALLRPSVSEVILDAYGKKDGDEPRIYTIDLGRLFHVMAREIGGLTPEELDRLEEMRASLEAYRQVGLTDKNLKAIREMMAGDSFQQLLRLPFELMKRAREANYSSPKKAAVLAQMAVAIRILCVAPIRLQNLSGIRLGEHLVKPGGPDGRYRLIFPDREVKNRVDLDFPLGEDTTELINEYVHDFRPYLLYGRNEDWLFPGAEGGAKGKTTLSGQITDKILREIGVRLTAHQFRHLAAAKILERYPGNYELARRLLGHRNIQVTIRFYVGLETGQASQIYGDLMTEQLSEDLRA